MRTGIAETIVRIVSGDSLSVGIVYSHCGSGQGKAITITHQNGAYCQRGLPAIETAWQMEGMGRPCWVDRGESRAPVPQKRIRCTSPY